MTTGRKPEKPVSTKVQARIDELQRRRGVKTLAKRFLVVCEDSKSAKNYFDALQRHLNLSASSFKAAPSKGGRTQPIQVVEEAINLREAAKQQSGTVPFTQTWCVIDGDYGTKVQAARIKANAHQINLAISTKCFEYWVLLHFEEYNKSAMNCKGVEHVLRKRHMKDYEKGKCDFRKVVENYELARERAERLRELGIRQNPLPENHNPCSEIYKLINEIIKLGSSGFTVGRSSRLATIFEHA